MFSRLGGPLGVLRRSPLGSGAEGDVVATCLGGFLNSRAALRSFEAIGLGVSRGLQLWETLGPKP